MTLLLVDGTNILMRCAFGGARPPAEAAGTAAGMIERAVRELRASHLIIALDNPDVPSWRRAIAPSYKANRDTKTADWIVAGVDAFNAKRWQQVMCRDGSEADDAIATLATRASGRGVWIVSSDSDLLSLVSPSVRVARPQPGAQWQFLDVGAVRDKYDIPSPSALTDFKAIVGEKGDNIAGVPGVGAKSASRLLAKFPTLEEIIVAGAGGYSLRAELVHANADAARFAHRLVSLKTDVDIAPINPASCLVRRSA